MRNQFKHLSITLRYLVPGAYPVQVPGSLSDSTILIFAPAPACLLHVGAPFGFGLDLIRDQAKNGQKPIRLEITWS